MSDQPHHFVESRPSVRAVRSDVAIGKGPRCGAGLEMGFAMLRLLSSKCHVCRTKLDRLDIDRIGEDIKACGEADLLCLDCYVKDCVARYDAHIEEELACAEQEAEIE